jgi:hypothetical protein
VEQKDPGYTVVLAAVKAEVGRWDELAERVAPVHSSVQGAHLGLTAFFVADPSAMVGLANVDGKAHADAYNHFVTVMENLLAGAKTEFPQIAGAVTKIANAYEAAEKIVEIEHLNEIYKA